MDQIYSRIITQESFNYSSFAYDLAKIKHVLDKATGRSLILLDEFGCGTLTADGTAIAAAVIQQMVERSSCPLVLFASHLNEILQERFLASTPQISYFCMASASQDMPHDSGLPEARLVPLYQVEAGKALESNAISCATNAGLPLKLIKRAEEVLRFLVDGSVLCRHHEFSKAGHSKVLKQLQNLNQKDTDEVRDFILHFS